MITVTIKKTGMLRKAWRMRVTGGNNAVLGHAYNECQSAVDTATKMFGSAETVRLHVYDETGLIYTEKYIR